MGKLQLKNYIKVEQSIKWKKHINKTCDSKSKVKYLMDRKQKSDTRRPMYMNSLHKNNAKFIFLYRSRMLDVKNNYRNAYKDNICRWCAKEEETQEHILEICESFPIDRNNVKTADVFSEDCSKLKTVSEIIMNIDNELTESSNI